MTAITAVGLAARGQRGLIFQGVDADIPASSLAAVVGRGGSGRTSLLLALSGRFRLLSGRVKVGRYEAPQDLKAIRRVVAVARARPAIELDQQLRVAELLAERRAIAGPEVERHFRTTSDLVGIDVRQSTRVEELVPADRLLLALALALAEGPTAVVVDDVDAGSTPEDLERVWGSLRSVADAGPTVVASATAVPPDGLADVLVHLPGAPDER
ncbi:ATP-binding cassette domain-containing protein [Flindersiella endophytica]